MRALVHYRWCIDIRHFYFTLQNNRPRSCWLIHHVMMEDSQKWAALFSSFLFRATTNNFFFLRTTTINQQFRSVGNLFLCSFSRRCKYKPTTVVEATAIWTNLRVEQRAISIHRTHTGKRQHLLLPYICQVLLCVCLLCSQHATNFALLFPTPETLVCFHLDGVRDRPNSFETKRNCFFYSPSCVCCCCTDSFLEYF